MPINKDSLTRYRIEDRLLSDPNYSYTTHDILREVNKALPHEDRVQLRMIQKDIKALNDMFGKKVISDMKRGGHLQYEDQSSPLFYQELTLDEERLLREVLNTLGQFDGLDNFTWLDLLKKKLDMDDLKSADRPVMVFSKSDLQMAGNLLGRLYTAISRRKVIRLTYKKFGGETRIYDLYPYQLKQYNERWFLLATPLGSESTPLDMECILNLALDRIEDFEYIDDRGPYVDTPLDLSTMYDDVVGVTLDKNYPEAEDIYLAVKPSSVNYIQTKPFHMTQMQLDKESTKQFIKCYPSLEGCTFFTICCRMNFELLSKILSFGEDIVVVDEPSVLRNEPESRSLTASKTMEKVMKMAENYRRVAEDINKKQ